MDDDHDLINTFRYASAHGVRVEMAELIFGNPALCITRAEARALSALERRRLIESAEVLREKLLSIDGDNARARRTTNDLIDSAVQRLQWHRQR